MLRGPSLLAPRAPENCYHLRVPGKNAPANTSLSRDPLFWLLAAGAAAQFFMLGSGSFTIDEVGTLVIARQPAENFLPFVLHLGFNPPLFNALAWPWRAAGEGVLWLRLLPFLLGVAALEAYRRFCADLFAAPARPEAGGVVTAAAARLAMFLGAFSPFWVNLSQQFRMYSLFLLLAIAANWLFLRALRGRGGRGERALYGLTLLLGLYTHYYFGFVWAAQTLTGLLLARPRGAGLLGWQAGAMALFAPWLAAGVKAAGVVSGVQSMGWGAPLSFFGNFLLGWGAVDLLIPRWISAAGAAGLAVFAAALWRLRRAYPAETALALLHLVLPLAAVPALEALTGNSLSMPRYWLFITPFFYLFTSAWAEGLPGRARYAARLALMITAMGSLAGYYILKAEVDPFFGAAAARLRPLPPGSLALHTSAYWYMPLKYYYAPGLRHCLLYSPSEINGFIAAGWLPDQCVVESSSDPVLGAGPFLLVDPYRRISGQVLSASSAAALRAAGLLK